MFNKVSVFILLACLLCVPQAFAEKLDNSINFLSLSDIHFDPFIACYDENSTPCPLIEKLRAAPSSQWSAIFTEYDTALPQYRLDTNYSLLTSALSALKKISNTQQAKFVFILGDFLGHDYRKYYKKYSNDKSASGYQSFTKKTFEFLNSELAKTFPNKDVYPVVGNNDSYHSDYSSDPNGPFYNDLSGLWSTLIKDKNNRAALQKDFPKGGYYAVTAPGSPHLRLIMLNTVLFSYKARGKGVDKAADEELKWLHKQLASAKEHNQKVFIAMHIPTGIDVYATLRIHLFTLIEFWQKKYIKRFHEELRQYSPEIAGIFAGHLHSDWFQILSFDGVNDIPVTGTPSISPIFGNNPGFKLYTYSPTTFQIEDFITYFYPLNNNRVWDIEYDFNQIYQPNCRTCSILNGMKLLQPSGNLAPLYTKFYVVSTELPVATDLFSQWDPYYWCAIRDINAKDYRQCIGVSNMA